MGGRVGNEISRMQPAASDLVDLVSLLANDRDDLLIIDARRLQLSQTSLCGRVHII